MNTTEKKLYTLKLDPTVKERLETAAQKRGVSLAAFMTYAATKEADEVLSDAP